MTRWRHAQAAFRVYNEKMPAVHEALRECFVPLGTAGITSNHLSSNGYHRNTADPARQAG